MIASIKGYVEILKELLQADINTDQQAKVRDVCIPQHHVPNRYHSYLIHSIVDSLAIAMLYSRMVYLVNLYTGTLYSTWQYCHFHRMDIQHSHWLAKRAILKQ